AVRRTLVPVSARVWPLAVTEVASDGGGVGSGVGVGVGLGVGVGVGVGVGPEPPPTTAPTVFTCVVEGRLESQSTQSRKVLRSIALVAHPAHMRWKTRGIHPPLSSSACSTYVWSISAVVSDLIEVLVLICHLSIAGIESAVRQERHPYPGERRSPTPRALE